MTFEKIVKQVIDDKINEALAMQMVDFKEGHNAWLTLIGSEKALQDLGVIPTDYTDHCNLYRILFAWKSCEEASELAIHFRDMAGYRIYQKSSEIIVTALRKSLKEDVYDYRRDQED